MNPPALFRNLLGLAAAAITAAPSTARAADPTTADCLAANNSSIDLRNAHRLRDAREKLLICAANSCPADIRKECLHRVDEVNAQIPTILFEAKDSAGNDLSSVRVTMDGQPFAEHLEGTALSADPGEHTFVFATQGHPPVTRRFIVQEAQKDRRESITFGAPAPGGSLLAGPSSAAGTTETGQGLGTQKVIALVAGAVGVVGLGVGTAFGLATMSKKNDAEAVCPSSCGNQEGVDKWNDAATTGNLATAFVIAGGVALAAGVVLWFTAPSNGGANAQVGVGPGSFELEGTW